MTAVVEARFAGGALQVDVTDFNGVGGVTLTMPGNIAGMFPDEARALAAALIAAADAAARPNTLRRRTSVDEALRSIEQ